MSQDSESAAGTAPMTAGDQAVPCEIPGCTQLLTYSGSGRRPKYCGKTIDGIRHTRLTAHRISRGELSVPTPGSGGAVATDDENAGESGPRPVTLARLTLETLRTEIRDAVTGHETRMSGLAEQFAAALAVASDPDAAMAEVSAAHRDARTAIDAAEAERDTALARARDAERAAALDRQDRETAETAAEQALEHAEAASEERDQASR